ncbi:MAG: potassium channel family protein [Chloroflexi bacterium]|nr:potassium channel family protein [Chloroflexota bacterium]
MPGFVWMFLGIAVLLALIVDAGWTTLWPDRSGGPLSSRIAAFAWRQASTLFAGRNTVLSLMGPIVVALVLLVWVVLLWGGWFLIFSAAEVSVVDATTRERASGFDRLYFVGYTVFTLGNGDWAPNGAPWQLATVLATASGLILVTLAITYLISVLSAVVNKRTFAARVHAIAETPEDFVRVSWDGSAFSGLDLLLTSLAEDLARLATQHLAYPVIHYYHPSGRIGSTAVAVAVLDEAVTMMAAGVDAHARPSRAVLRSVRGSVEDYLETLSGGSVRWADADPPLPDLEDVRIAGIPTVGDAEYHAEREQARDRRRKLRGLVESDGWEWFG